MNRRRRKAIGEFATDELKLAVPSSTGVGFYFQQSTYTGTHRYIHSWKQTVFKVVRAFWDITVNNMYV